MNRSTLHRRLRGFTLIELLIVMGILSFLFGLGVAFLPGIYQRWEAARGGEIVVNALARARQEARRSGRPTGIRLNSIPNPSDATKYVVMTLQFVQQPVDLFGGTVSVATPQTTDLTKPIGFTQTVTCNQNLPTSSVGLGDYLIVGEGGVPHKIASSPGGGASFNVNNVLSVVDTTRTPNVTVPASYAFPYGLPAGTPFRIVRQPRIMQGEQDVKLPQKVGIDILVSTTIVSNLTGSDSLDAIKIAAASGANGPVFDIMFAPNGGLAGTSLAATDKIVLYVRDVSSSDFLSGQPSLVVIYARTGFIGAQPVARPPDPMYYYTNDTRASGM